MNHSLVIVQLVPALNNGGVERGTVEVANYLAKQGHTSIIVSSGGKMESLLSESVQHITLEIGKKSFSSLLLIKKLRALFLELKADIVHARSRLPAWLTYKAVDNMVESRPKFITTIHGLYSVKGYSAVMARGDRVIAVSKTAENYVKKNYPSYLKGDPTIIYRGINPKEFPYDYDPDFLWLQKWYKINHQLVGHQVVLMPGRLTSLKGVKELENWLLSESDAKLVLTADPEIDSYAEKLHYWFEEIGVVNRVVWVGLQDLMAEVYAVADVVVSASTRPESFGRTVLESLSIGTPVVAYNHGGVGEILTEMFEQGKVELRNKQELSDKINQVLRDKPKVLNQRPFLLKHMLEKTEQLYKEVVSG